jgi:hypothetical protein
MKQVLLKVISAILFFSLLVNIIFIIKYSTLTTKDKKISQELNKTQQQIKNKENMDKSRMNGTVVLKGEENVNFEKTIQSSQLPRIGISDIKNIKFNKNTYNFESTFDRFFTTTKDGIEISIEKIKKESPYLVLYYPSEWLGVMSIEPLVRYVITGSTPDSKIYNTEINGIYYAKNYGFFKPSGSVGLSYETVQESQDYNFLYYYRFSIWEGFNISDKDYYNAVSNPNGWFSKNPSAKFMKLDAFIKENVKIVPHY